MLSSEQKSLLMFFPSGRPAPAVLTSAEVINLLRLEGDNPERTLKYYRDEGMLKGIMLGRRLRYRLIDVERFLALKAGDKTD